MKSEPQSTTMLPDEDEAQELFFLARISACAKLGIDPATLVTPINKARSEGK